MYHLRYGLPGPQRLDHVNIKQAAVIVGIFGIITIISYFNELAKQGLLTGKEYRYYPQRQFEGDADTAHIKRGADQIDLDLAHLKSVLKINTSRKARSPEDAENINIALHLGRNNSYQNAENSLVKIVIYKNVMTNFFRVIYSMRKSSRSDNLLGNRTMSQLLFSNNCMVVNNSNSKIVNETTIVKQNNSDVIRKKLCQIEKEEFSKRQKELQNKQVFKLAQNYSEAVKVFVYQHEVGGYALRDCFKKLSKYSNLTLLNTPLNQGYRKEWEMVPENKRNKYDALYGSLSFGVCENVHRPCLYTTMLAHPLDRILQVYFQCRQNNTHNLCNFYRSSNSTKGDLHGFIKATGNSFFKKLIYYSKQCRLVGDDEICINDNKATFILTQKERHLYLDNVLNNLHKWFGVVGLVDQYAESLQLFEFVTGLNFTTCPIISQNIVPKKYQQILKSNNDASKVLYEDLIQLKKRLLNDSQVVQWLYADLAIYNKIESIFKEQWKEFHVLHQKPSSENQRHRYDKAVQENNSHIQSNNFKKRLHTDSKVTKNVSMHEKLFSSLFHVKEKARKQILKNKRNYLNKQRKLKNVTNPEKLIKQVRAKNIASYYHNHRQWSESTTRDEMSSTPIETTQKRKMFIKKIKAEADEKLKFVQNKKLQENVQGTNSEKKVKVILK